MVRCRFTICLSLFLVVGLCVANRPALAQRNKPKVQQVVDATVTKEMKRQNITGVSVGLIIKSRVVYTQGYGFADLDNQVRASENTVMNWASNSKPVLAVLAMQLVQSGSLDLDATIDNYIPELPEHLHSITPRHLLCHQSGIPHYSNGKIVKSESYNESADEHDPLVALERFIESPLLFEPGEKKDYSSYAYVLLSAVVQAAGEEPIADQISSRITGPLKMNSFQLDVPFDGQENWTKAYRLSNGKPVEIEDEAHYWKHGAGAYKSDVTDFAKFAVALMKSKLIKRKTSIQMMTVQTTKDGKETDFGLGVRVSGTGKSLKVYHGGAQDETRTRMVIFPNRRHGVVVMCNCRHANPTDISTAIYKALKAKNVKY